MRVQRLSTVEGFIAFDLDDCRVNAGGTRLAPDVTEAEACLLAKAMTYKFAALELEMGGAKAVIRAGAAERTDVMRRYREEIRPLVESVRFLTGPDLGTFEDDFAPLRRPGETGVLSQPIDGVPFEDVLTGFGVVAAAEVAIRSLQGATVAIEGFGKVGGGVAREVVRRGATVVAVSTLGGCVVNERGLDVAELWAKRAQHGDNVVRHVGGEVRASSALFEIAADVLVPGARTGTIDADRARRITARVVAPAANVPYAAGVPEILRGRGIHALPDFVCNAGAVIGYISNTITSHQEMLALVERRIGEILRRAMEHPQGPFAGGCAVAEAFLRRWRPSSGMPQGPPLA